MVEEKAELRSGVTAPFNKRLNEALQFNPQMPFNIGNTVTPSQLIGVLKGEQGTPGLPAAISAVKDDNNLIALTTSQIERGILSIQSASTSVTGTGTFNTDFTIPVGKKWLLKGVNMFMASGTNTITSMQLTIFDPLVATSSMTLAVGSTSLTSLITTPILVTNQFKIRAKTVCGTFAGEADTTTRLLIQEITI